MEQQEEQILKKITEQTYLLRKNASMINTLMTGITILVLPVGMLACFFFGTILGFFD